MADRRSGRRQLPRERPLLDRSAASQAAQEEVCIALGPGHGRAALVLDPFPAPGVPGPVDRHGRGEHRHVDVQRRGELADDGAERRSADGLHGAGRGQPADVLFALPAGALADIVDRRRLLIVVETAICLVSAVFAAFVWLDLVTPMTLLLFTFLVE